jgi:hypothetical protein
MLKILWNGWIIQENRIENDDNDHDLNFQYDYDKFIIEVKRK